MSVYAIATLDPGVVPSPPSMLSSQLSSSGEPQRVGRRGAQEGGENRDIGGCTGEIRRGSKRKNRTSRLRDTGRVHLAVPGL